MKKTPVRPMISKKIRATVKAKYGGRCAYCGEALPSRWHVDHLVPISSSEMNTVEEMNAFSNLMPSCIACNLFKSVFSIGEFRFELSKQVERLERNVNFRFAMKFKQLLPTPKHVMFYFERLKQ